MKTILLTGHNGFVGTNLIRAFQKDHNLVGLDIPQHNPAKTPPLPPETSFSWDQLHELPAVDTIIHLAGKAHDTANVSAPEEYFEVNMGLTKRIFDHFLQSEAINFIFFSSVKAVADTVEGEILTEAHTPDPKTPYGQSKFAAEQYILEKTRQHEAGASAEKRENKKPDAGGTRLSNDHQEAGGATSEKRVYILRPCMIHGPGNKGNLNLLYKVVHKGVPWPLGAFHNQRSFLSIANLAFVIRQLIEKDITPGIYQVADDEPLSTNRLIELMAQSLNRRTRIWKLPAGIIHGMARTGDILHLPLNSERLKKLTESYVVSNKKIKTALGVEKMPTSATNGIIHTLKSFTD